MEKQKVSRIFATFRFNDEKSFSTSIQMPKNNGQNYVIYDQYLVYNLLTKAAELFLDCEQVRCKHIYLALREQYGAKSIQINTFSTGYGGIDGARFAYNRITSEAARPGFESVHFGTRRLVPVQVAYTEPKVNAEVVPPPAAVIENEQQVDELPTLAAIHEEPLPVQMDVPIAMVQESSIAPTVLQTLSTMATSQADGMRALADANRGILTLASLSEQLLKQRDEEAHLRHVSDGRLGAEVKLASAAVRAENAQLQAALSVETAGRQSDAIEKALLTRRHEEDTEKIEALKLDLEASQATVGRLTKKLAARGQPKRKERTKKSVSNVRVVAAYLRAIMGVKPCDGVPLYEDSEIVTCSSMLQKLHAFANLHNLPRLCSVGEVGKAMAAIAIDTHAAGVHLLPRVAGSGGRNRWTFDIPRTVAALHRVDP